MKRKILLLMMTALLSVGAWATEIWNEGATLNWNYFTLPKMSMTAGDILTFHITSVGDGWSVMDLYTTDETKEGWDKKDTKLMSLDHRSGSNVIVFVTDDIASAAPDGIIVYGENNVVVSSVDYEKKPSSYNLFSGSETITWSSEKGLSSAPFAGVQAGDLLKIEISAVGGSEWGDDVQLRSSSWGGDETILKSAKAYSATTVTFEFDDDLVTAAKTNGLYIRGNEFTVTSVDIVYTPTVSIGSAGYATLGYPAALDLTGIEAYTAAVSGDKVVLTSVKGKKIPAGTGIILEGSGDVTIPLTTDATDDITGNELLVSDGTVKGDESTIYVLANGTNGVGFYLLKNGYVHKGKAYLQITPSASVRQFIGFGDNTTTGISQIENGELNTEDAVFNLSGQRVAQPTKGLYVVNGKKVVITK